MWVAVTCGVVLYLIVKIFFYEDDTLLDLASSHSTALFAVAKRLEKLYHGSKVYVGIQIPDADSASRRNIDLVLVTNHEAVVITVKNLSGFVSIDKDGNWMCTDGKYHKTNCIPNPVTETKQLVSILEDYLETRGVTLPKGYLSFKVICPNPKFCSISDSFPSEVIPYDKWKQLKPEMKSSYSGWIKGVVHGGKDKMHDAVLEKLKSVLSTSPISDRLQLKGNRYILGEFLEFKGKEDDIVVLGKIRRSKVSHLSIQKISMFGFARSTVQVLYAPRGYRVEGEYREVTVRSSTQVVFLPQNSTEQRKYKLSSIISISLSA